MPKLSAEQQAFLRDNPFPGVLTTLRPDGSPHATVVWVDADDGDVLVNTYVGRAKERHLRRNPNASLIVVDPSDMYHWISVSGRASLELDGAHEHINELSHRYDGKDFAYKDGTTRIIARIHVDKVDTYGFD